MVLNAGQHKQPCMCMISKIHFCFGLNLWLLVENSVMNVKQTLRLYWISSQFPSPHFSCLTGNPKSPWSGTHLSCLPRTFLALGLTVLSFASSGRPSRMEEKRKRKGEKLLVLSRSRAHAHPGQVLTGGGWGWRRGQNKSATL